MRAQEKEIVRSADELSLFMFFISDPHGMFDFQNYSLCVIDSEFIKPLDDFYLYGSKSYPSIKMDKRLETFIEESEKMYLEGKREFHVDIVFELLKMNKSGLKKIV